MNPTEPLEHYLPGKMVYDSLTWTVTYTENHEVAGEFWLKMSVTPELMAEPALRDTVIQMIAMERADLLERAEGQNAS